MLFQDLKGQKFNKLTIIEYVGKTKQGQSLWDCICDCGNVKKAVAAHHLKSGNITSCGCGRSESHIIHGQSNTPEWNSYHAAKKRCNPKNKDKYPDWAGRGIRFKFRNFQEFIDHIGLRPEPKFEYSLERIDNDGHYEAGNVKWATKVEQARNRRCDNCQLMKEALDTIRGICYLSRSNDLAQHILELPEMLALK